MKPDFLRQISRMLVFGMLITGFPVNDLFAGPPICSGSEAATTCPLNFNFAATSTTPSSCPSLQDATKKYNPSTINLNVGASGSCLSCLSSPNSPTNISTYGITPLTNFSTTDTNSAPMKYETTTSNLLAALSNYQSAIQQYGTLMAVNTSIINALSDLAPNINASGVLSPLAPAAAQYAQVATAQSGDFLPVLAAGYNSGQMFVNFLSSNATQLWYQQLVVGLIMYTLLSSTAGLTYTNLMATQNIFTALANGGSYTPPTPSGSSSSSPAPVTSSSVLGYLSNVSGFQFTGGSPSTAALNLLINVSSGNWLGIYNDPTQVAALVTVFSTINPTSSQFTGFFSSNAIAYTTYYVNTFKAIQSNSNLYMDCSLDFNTGLAADNTSIYYAGTTSEVTSDLATQFVNDQIAGTANTATPITSTTAIQLVSTGVNNVPFSYKNGPFYIVGSILSNTDAQTMWTQACAKSSSPGLLASQNSAIQALAPLLSNQGAPLTSPDNTEDGAAQYGLDTLEGRMQNLLIAAKAAINQPPISGISSADASWWAYTPPAGVAVPALTNYDWVNSYNPGAAQTVEQIVSVDGTVKVTPSLLPNFIDQSTITPAYNDTTAFAYSDNLNMLYDLIKIRMNYSEAWVNLSLCASQVAPPKGAGFDCTGTYDIDVKVGSIHVKKGADFFSARCWNDSIGRAILAQVTSVPGIIFMIALMGAPIAYKLIKTKLTANKANKAAVEEKTAADPAPEKTANPYDVPTDGGVQPGPGPGPNPVQPKVSDNTFEQLQEINTTNEQQLEQFQDLNSYQKLTLRNNLEQQLIDLKAQVEEGNEAAQEELTKAKANATEYNEKIAGTGENPIEIPE